MELEIQIWYALAVYEQGKCKFVQSVGEEAGGLALDRRSRAGSDAKTPDMKILIPNKIT